MDRQEIIAEVAMAADAELNKMEKARIQVSSPREILKQLFKGMRNPQPAEENIITASPLPVIPEQFPRLLASYGKKTPEYITVNNYAEWSAYHDWYTVFPPQQPAGRPILTTFQSEVERLEREGLRERPREEHERRRQTKGYIE